MRSALSVAALLLLSSTMSFADSPDILKSVSKNSIQVIAKDDAAKTRGGYKQCYNGSCIYFTSYRNSSNVYGPYVFLTKIATYYDKDGVKFYMSR